MVKVKVPKMGVINHFFGGKNSHFGYDFDEFCMEQDFMPLKFKMSTSPGSMNFEVYMPKNRRFGPFFGDVES